MRKSLTAIGATIAGWTFLALLFTPQTYLVNLRAPNPLSVWQAFAANSMTFYIWAVLTPVVFWLGSRLPLEGAKFRLHLFILFLLAFPVALLHIALIYAANSIFLHWSETYRSPAPITALLVGYGATNVMVYWGTVAVSQAFIYFNRYREREKSLAQAQLQALKTQLNPHFLFNTLNAISELVYENAEEAEQTIGKLSELLRMTLRTEQAQEIALHEELEFLQKYLEIQQTLLQERLRVCWRIAPETLSACVPNMILQPLVENSIRHGIAPLRKGGTLTVISAREGERLVLRVQDDGLGFAAHLKSEKEGGIGLLNTRNRLRHLYGDEYKFTLATAYEGKGAATVIEIPFAESSKKYDAEDTHFDS